MTDRPAPSRAQSYAFRALFIYVVAYSFPFPLSAIPLLDQVAVVWAYVWQLVVVAFAEHVLGTSITVMPNGSGDTTFNWVEIVVFAALALGGAAIWIVVDRAPREHAKAREFLRIYLRFVLASAMFGYGFAKVVPQQFAAPSVDRLLTTYGESSPMGLLWTFMGASTAYQVFSGAMEVVGALLLLGKRTATAGALVTAAVLTNVVMLNFCYDVPVKLYSTHLLLMAVLVIAPDALRLVAAVLMGRSVGAAPIAYLFEGRRARIAGRVLKYAFLAAVALREGIGIVRSLSADARTGAPSIVGAWTVTEFRRDGVPLPMLVDDPTIWRRVSVSPWGALMLRRMSGPAARYFLDVDEAAQTLDLRPFGQREADPYRWTWSRPDDDRLILRDSGERLEVTLRRTDADEFVLTTRGFHWINETPFNY
jgi:hypothetical protein